MARAGYVEGKNTTYVYGDANFTQALMPQMLTQIASRKPAVILTLTTSVSQTALSAVADRKLPMVFAMVTDPVAAGLVEGWDHGSSRFVGASDMQDFDAVLVFAKKLFPNARSFGTLYNPGEANDVTTTRKLEEAGYLEREGDELTLTARAIRKIADRALREIFVRLKRDRAGGHALHRRGAGGDQTDESKAYEFGDPFLLDLKQTVMNGVQRRGPGTPVGLVPGDFEVLRTELRTQAATVVMLDMSRSMLNNGYFLPAKKVALALHALIKGQFPRDALYIVGFSLYARTFTAEQLPSLSWSEWNIGSNMHAGFALSRRLLGKHPRGTKQILMVTDGEPTAHLENCVADFSYPPSARTVEETRKEVQRCTREGITINTFMLERSSWLVGFVEQMARINHGRAFMASPDRLGEYVVVDFVRSRRRLIGR